VLQLMRDIHNFVATYNYNMNNQIFVERSDAKNLNTITIGHIANSIRTHGIGIMNTTVNYIYQFLKQKFIIFSQYLYDDNIKSMLLKDIRFFKENREKLNNRYPYDRAFEFTKEIRKLGINDQKQSSLDQFRTLITEIGNAMGYIRMLRSGGFQYISNAIKFVPDLQEIVPFTEMAEKESLSSETVEAAKNLDSAIGNLSKNFAEGTEYFSLLVSVFAEQFRSEQNLHLKTFYIILPPLAINFVEHILAGKEKLQIRKPGGFFTDDGFAMGIAYILKLFDQESQFKALHWFEEVQNKFSQEIKKVEAEMAKQKKDDQKATSITLEKLHSRLLEYQLLKSSFDAAKIFFHSS
jgi:WASH complex subunit 7